MLVLAKRKSQSHPERLSTAFKVAFKNEFFMGQDVIMDKKNPRIMRGEDRDGVRNIWQ